MKSYLGWKVDFANPRGAPAFLGPDSVHWRVYKNPIALGVGGIAAVLLEFADPRIRSGVWDHSRFKLDPVGRMRRTAMAAMVSVYGPRTAARRIAESVAQKHARVVGKTPAGEAYRALDVELLDWVGATAAYGFLTAYDRFVSRVSAMDKVRFHGEAQSVAALYGASSAPGSDAEFLAMMERLADRFEPHPIIGEFLTIVESGAGTAFLPRAARRAVACAAVSILPKLVRQRLELGGEWDPSPFAAAALQTIAVAADRIPVPGAPPAQACRRIGLPGDFLYRSPRAQAHILKRWSPPDCDQDFAIDVVADLASSARSLNPAKRLSG
jgi:uncharacterized protein (DUF2236 family)